MNVIGSEPLDFLGNKVFFPSPFFFFLSCGRVKFFNVEPCSSKRYVTIDELVEEVSGMFHAYDADTFERVWQSLSKRYNQVLRALGGGAISR